MQTLTMKTLTKAAATAVRTPLCVGRSHSKRWLHQTMACRAITNLEMPAMSPTMTEGGIAGWKKKEGETFVAGDVLLEIETDKATIDVEAQDDGVMGKILLPDGSKNVAVGKVIALLAEEGDDISNLEPPKEEPTRSKKQEASSSAPPPPSEPTPQPQQSASASTPITSHSPSHPPSHPRPLFPSVHRLLLEHAIPDPSVIKGTGIRGMLTKGDVLAHLGLASGPMGTYKEPPREQVKVDGKKVEEYKPLDGSAIRQLIVSTMLQASLRARNYVPVPKASPDFDSIIADYLPSHPSSAPKTPASPPVKSKTVADYLEGLY